MEERSPELSIWLTEIHPLTHYNMKGCQTIESKPEQTGFRGSVAFYDKTGVEYQVREIESELEYLVENYKSTNLKWKIWKEKFERKNFSRFDDLMESMFAFLMSQINDCIIFCDFNVNTKIEDTDKKTYTNLLASYG